MCFFHSFHYHLVNWSHLQIVSILFLRLIKSVTSWLLSDALLLILLNFKNQLFRGHPMTYSYSVWYSLTIYALVGAFWSLPPIYVTMFWTLVKAIFTLFLFYLNLLGHLPTSTINSLHKSNSSSNNIGNVILAPYHPSLVYSKFQQLSTPSYLFMAATLDT
jgi:hypothetical protein